MFSEQQKAVLSNFVTNLDKPVFALKNLPEVVKGALFSRYSRTSKGVRELLLTEFLQNQDVRINAPEEISKKAEEFYDRVLVEYGDDSVGELGGAHIALEGISMIATKALQDSRIGLSPLEKSTRYVFFNEKQDGRHRFYREPAIMNSEFAQLYEETCNMLFDAYSELIEPMKTHIMKTFPKPHDMSDRAYAFTVRAKACDILRAFLPAATLTNMGFYGNGRAFEYLLLKAYASPLQELRDIAGSMQEELAKVIPSFVKRANESYGKVQQDYFRQTYDGARNLALSVTKESPEIGEESILVEYDEDAVNKVTSSILYAHSSLSMLQSKSIVSRMTEEEKEKIIDEYTKRRINRRHRPGRAFEVAYYTFDILGNYGIYRDLHRHRALTQQRQLLTCRLGYDTPAELKEIGAEGKYQEAMKKAALAWERMQKKFPHQAQYVVPFGYRIRWHFTRNARELYHLTELRTVQQGHPDYRRICQKIASAAMKTHPPLFKNMKFVDFNSYGMERSESEKKIDKKLEEVSRKYGAA